MYEAPPPNRGPHDQDIADLLLLVGVPLALFVACGIIALIVRATIEMLERLF
jgi:hypothetical protein